MEFIDEFTQDLCKTMNKIIYALIMTIVSCSGNKHDITEDVKIHSLDTTSKTTCKPFYYIDTKDSGNLIIAIDSFLFWTENFRILLKKEKVFQLKSEKNLTEFIIENDEIKVINMFEDDTLKYKKSIKEPICKTYDSIEFRVSDVFYDDFKKTRIPIFNICFKLNELIIRNKITNLEYKLKNIDRRLLTEFVNICPPHPIARKSDSDTGTILSSYNTSIIFYSNSKTDTYRFEFIDSNEYSRKLYDKLLMYFMYKYRINFTDYNPAENYFLEVQQIKIQ